MTLISMAISHFSDVKITSRLHGQTLLPMYTELMNIYVQGTIEEKIFQRQITKQGLNTVLDFDGAASANDMNVTGGLAGTGRGDPANGGRGTKWAAKFTREELRDLFSLREETLCDTHDLVRCGCGRAGKECSTAHEASQVGIYSSTYMLLR